MSYFECDPISGNVHSRKCELTRGGLIKTIYAANLSQFDRIVMNGDEISQIIMKTDPMTSAPYFWYQIIPKDNTAGLSNPLTVGTNNNFFAQTLNFSVGGFEPKNKLAFQNMASGGRSVFIGQDANLNFHLMGHRTGAKMTAGDIGVGTAADDLVGGSATFVAEETIVTPTIQAGTAITVLSADGINTETVTL